MEKKNSKNIIIGIAIIVVIAIIIVAACVSSNRAGNGGASEQNGTQTEASRPTFTYFISESDENYDVILENIETLKGEYEDQIVFDIKKMEDAETQEIAANLPIEGNTPVVFMSTGVMEMNCSDIERLEEIIDSALSTD